MKSRRRRVPFHGAVPFSYELYGNIDVNDDEFLNFTGRKGAKCKSDIAQFLRNASFAPGGETALKRSLYLQFQPEVENEVAHAAESADKNNSFSRVEEESPHVWFISQSRVGAMPFARNFTTAEQFLHYAKKHSVSFPTAPKEATGKTTTTTAAGGGGDPAAVVKWLDIQTTNRSLLTEILSNFPLSEDTVNLCHYLDGMDRLVAHSALGYFFFNLMCSPIAKDGSEEEGPDRHRKGVLQRRLDAAMAGRSHSSLVTALPVAAIVFPEWIITIHEKPFHELGDLLRFLHVNCVDCSSGPSTKAKRPRQPMTSPFIFSSLFQIVVGHQLDNVALTMTLDRIGDHVFQIEENSKEREEVIERITNVRRCFAECAVELTRREHIASLLLQPHMMNSFLTQEKVVCRQLEGVRAYLLRLNDEVSDARDTVAVTNWYHNTACTWNLLCRGNKALRQTLLLTELTNIMYPVITVQTLYSMNVPLPFDSEHEPPTMTLTPFFVVMGVILVYLLLCARALYALFHRKRWATRLLSG